MSDNSLEGWSKIIHEQGEEARRKWKPCADCGTVFAWRDHDLCERCLLRAELEYTAASAWMWGCEDEECPNSVDGILEACRWSETLYGQPHPVTGEPNIIGGCEGVVCGACCGCLCGSADEEE